MNWYYAENGQQKGPVSDMEFTNLIRQGVVKGESLVWQEGLPEWQALSKVRPDLLTASGPVIGGVVVPEENKDLVVQQLREGAVSEVVGIGAGPGHRFAGFWIRVAAKLIDWVLLMVVMMVLGVILFGSIFGAMSGGFNPEQMENDPSMAMGMAVGQLFFVVVIYALVVVYNSVMVYKYGGSLGKLAVGIRVVMPDGVGLTFGRSVGRAFADLISYAICFFLYVMPAFDEEKRALHDYICGTRVIYK